MRTLLVLLAACSANEIPAGAPANLAAKPAAIARVLPPVSGVHGNMIATVAMTEDGTAAVSADRLGALRLWPTLDGKVEPIVIAGQVPRALALAHDGDGFAIADLDAAGDLELIRTSARGEVHGHSKVGGDEPVTRVVALAAGMLVVRADQAIELYDTHAVREFRVVPEPSTHLVSIAARSGRVLALVSDDNVVRGRWLDVERGAWGPTTPVLDIDPARVVLSPDHHTIAAVSAKKKRKVFVDALTGKVGAQWCAEDDDGLERFRSQPTIALGFTDDQTLACSISTSVTWWSTAGKALGNSSSVLTSATGDGRVIGGAGSDLEIMTPTTLQFLGYVTRQYAHVRVTPAGILVGKGDQTATVLDASFQPVRTFTLPEAKEPWLDIIPLDSRYLLTLAMAAEADDTGVLSARIALRDTSNGEVVELPFHVRERELWYDPVTRLLATTDGSDDVILKWEPMNAQLSAPMRIAVAPSQAEVSAATAIAGWSVRKSDAPIVHLVDPALADGVVALVIHEEPGTMIVEELRDLKPGLAPVATRTYRLPGALLAVDRAGHIFVHNALESTAAVGYTGGLPTALLTEEASAVLRPSPDGKLLAAYDGARLTLHDAATGSSRWEVSLWGLIGVMWTMSGQLVAQFEGALATVDPATGALGDRRCGWEFQLGDSVHESIAEAPNVCDVAP